MPVLNEELAGQVDEAAASGGQFEALEPGVYTARLGKVEATIASTKSPMWKLEFEDIRDLDGDKQPGRQWTNLVLVDTAMWKVGQFFAAFGVSTKTDTEELVGHRCRLSIDRRVITKGKRTGEQGNEIAGFLPLMTTDDGFDRLAKMQNRLASSVKPGKAAGAKAAVKPAAAKDETAKDAPADALAPAPADDGESLEF